ncbi:hypothetical protein A2875_01845 [Candidatus Gottesmanbacteria bacterium RIFCSPHIGHO2_01_FULL_46_14]|uniref:Sodium/calcium exchanger membrane region domain-containing protein n=2 Tax=Candidatus Gottesmaniibacteriota TaxID=1752720 RepID=A0A1F5ZIX7_9BACT|nr:MAG: hypothetical protein A2875_01845 [Candidatus Gottesmanbacteria bacterium RIFCSPHIGHO2_01_FULL_46_14]OGG29775.1 MAG: hypothetical protein A2971_00770 [Candidatus Gottesmanbacteria bacterium RIFCSPLOWO2_01_FULL_46_21]
MTIWWDIGVMIGFGLILSGCAHLVIRGAAGIAKHAGLTSFTFGFLLLGILTSMPEMFVAIQAALTNIPQLATGNLLGGSILLLSLVMGALAVILGKVVLDHEISWQDMVSTIGVIAAPALVLWDGALTRGEGIFLVGAYGVHALLLTRDGTLQHPLHKHAVGHRHVHQNIGMFILGIAGLAIASRVIVTSAEVIIHSFSIPPIVFGLFFLSLGTNLPEFALAWSVIAQKRRDLAIGDFLGSAAANTLILGILAIISPYTDPNPSRVTAALVLLGSVAAYFLWSFWTGRSLSRKEGLGLLAFYAIFVAYELFG